MKSLRQLKLSLLALSALLVCTSAQAADNASTAPSRIAVVDFKTCVEKSKMGQKEQASFDSMKKQMESILEKKEKELSDVASKFNDIDYLDSLSPDAEAELKRQFRTFNQEFNQQQQQFYQTLSQTNMAIIQKLNDAVTKASKEVAASGKYDVIANADGFFFYETKYDVSAQIIKAMDTAFDLEEKDAKAAPAKS